RLGESTAAGDRGTGHVQLHRDACPCRRAGRLDDLRRDAAPQPRQERVRTRRRHGVASIAGMTCSASIRLGSPASRVSRWARACAWLLNTWPWAALVRVDATT